MKDTIVTARRKKTELITLLICFVVSNLLHLYAIIAYHAPFTEMITSIFYIIIFTFVLYAFWGILRLLFYGMQALFKKKNLININENKLFMVTRRDFLKTMSMASAGLALGTGDLLHAQTASPKKGRGD